MRSISKDQKKQQLARIRAIKTAEDMLAGEIGIIEGSREM